MRNFVFVLAMVVSLGGCAETILQQKTVEYGTTFGGLEDRIILQNLSSFVDDEDRLPSHIDFKQGTVQTTDNLSLGATLPFTAGRSGSNIVRNPSVFSVGALQTQSQDNWNYQPVTDVDDLVRVRCLYKYVINQSRRPDLYTTPADWEAFRNAYCTLSNQISLFRFGPPPKPWLIWSDATEGNKSGDYINKYGKRLSYLGTYGAYTLWGSLKEFHDFELAILGSMLNTTGAVGAAKTASPEVPATGLKLSIDATPAKFNEKGEKIVLSFTLENTGNVVLLKPAVYAVIANIKTKASLKVDCYGQATIEQASNIKCGTTYIATPEDAASNTLEVSAFVRAKTQSNSSIESNEAGKTIEGPNSSVPQTARARIPARGPRPTQQPIQSEQFTYPPFNPGKSFGALIPPPAAPAQ